MAILFVSAACLAARYIVHVVVHRAVAAGPADLSASLPRCETRLPADFCTCGQYALFVDEDGRHDA